MIRLSAESEPEIYATTKRFGTVLENVVIDPDTRELDLDDPTLAENSRGAYPIDFIPNSSTDNLGPVPKNVVMLTADAFGVLPPIAKLTPDQAMYHFLSGYTAKVAGTEIGVTEPQATFSTCFGAPFMPRHPVDLRQSAQGADRQGRGRLLAGQHRLDRRQIWRRQAHADQGDARASERGARRQPEQWRSSARTRISVSRCRCRCPGSITSILDPRGTWANPAEYDAMAAKLVDLFVENFAQFADQVDEGVRQAAPRVAQQQAQAQPSHSRLTARSRIGPSQGPDQ